MPIWPPRRRSSAASPSRWVTVQLARQPRRGPHRNSPPADARHARAGRSMPAAAVASPRRTSADEPVRARRPRSHRQHRAPRSLGQHARCSARAGFGCGERPVRSQVLARVHEATRPTRSRKSWRVTMAAATTSLARTPSRLRDQARRLERDHDISRNALNVLEQNTVGSGIDVIPAPRLPGQPVDKPLAQALRDLWDDWWDRPEVTWSHDFGKCQQLLARSWYRDGEAFFQTLSRARWIFSITALWCRSRSR
jgi:hypothetical protein